MSALKNTIMDMLRNKLQISITDKLNDNKDKNELSQVVLFKEYISDNELRIVDYDIYIKYGKDKIPTIDNLEGASLFKENGEETIIKRYENGILELELPLYNLLEYNDKLYISSPSEINNDFIYIHSAYNYARTMNQNTIEYFRRFNIDIFIYDDDEERKVDYYSEVIHSLFERSFVIRDEYKNIVDVAHIQSQLSFNVTEYNLSNKILRGSMLIKTYKIKE